MPHDNGFDLVQAREIKCYCAPFLPLFNVPGQFIPYWMAFLFQFNSILLGHIPSQVLPLMPVMGQQCLCSVSQPTDGVCVTMMWKRVVTFLLVAKDHGPRSDQLFDPLVNYRPSKVCPRSPQGVHQQNYPKVVNGIFRKNFMQRKKLTQFPYLSEYILPWSHWIQCPQRTLWIFALQQPANVLFINTSVNRHDRCGNVQLLGSQIIQVAFYRMGNTFSLMWQ